MRITRGPKQPCFNQKVMGRGEQLGPERDSRLEWAKLLVGGHSGLRRGEQKRHFHFHLSLR